MDNKITLSHGNGGKHMRQLIDEIFSRHLTNDLLDTGNDAALLPEVSQQIMTTVDGFTVQPLFFPGGDIGSLSVHGTVNDLAVSGAVAQYLTLGVIIEEGLEFEKLDKIVASMARAAKACGVKIVCGDTKVVPRGQGSEVYLTTTGIGYKSASSDFSSHRIKAGDQIIISGSIGDHGAAILLAREQFGLSGNLQSDSASVQALCQSIYNLDGVRFMRDPTRGGLATVLHELVVATGIGVSINQSTIPVADEVATICEMLGYEPYYLASEGRVLAVVSPEAAELVLSKWHQLAGGEQSTVIGEFTSQHQQVVLTTPLGGQRILAELTDDPLPRIC